MADKKQYVKGDGLKGTVADLNNFSARDQVTWTGTKKNTNKQSSTRVRGLKTLANSMKLPRRK
mgnify:FL=1|jgi:hypothetical protein|tara:strand:- start:223 stop:411 length:189 start_codon:yes stop_codon:yes gene_type:complete